MSDVIEKYKSNHTLFTLLYLIIKTCEKEEKLEKKHYYSIVSTVYRVSPLTARKIGSRPGSLPVIGKAHHTEPIPVS